MSLSRRDFVQLTVCSACLAGSNSALAGQDAPPSTPGPSPKRPAKATGPTLAGKTTDFPDQGHYDKLLRPHEILLFREKNRLVALSAECTHRRCIVRIREAELLCPCHGSQYAADGALLSGPADSSLPHLGISIKDGEVWVDPSVTFEERDWGKDGAFVEL